MSDLGGTMNTLTNKKIITIPNILSIIRICLIPIVAWFYCAEKNYVLAGSILILSGITDLADGYIARHYNMESDLGKIIDPFADKLTQATMLICLLLRYPLMLAPFILLSIKEIFMAIIGALVIKRMGIVMRARWHGKAATCLLYAMMILHIFWYDIPANLSAVLIFASVIMIGSSFVLYGMYNINQLKEYKKTETTHD